MFFNAFESLQRFDKGRSVETPCFDSCELLFGVQPFCRSLVSVPLQLLFFLLAARGSPRSTLSSSCSGVISLMSNSLSHLTWRRSAILLCLFQCFLSCICFQVSASPPDLFAQFSVILQRVSFFFPSLQCQELWVLCISRVFSAF